MSSHLTRVSRPPAAVTVTEADWTRVYKRALLERNPGLQMVRIEEARQMMRARSELLADYSLERQTIERALCILKTIGKARAYSV